MLLYSGIGPNPAVVRRLTASQPVTVYQIQRDGAMRRPAGSRSTGRLDESG
jgi:hypothetical protein